MSDTNPETRGQVVLLHDAGGDRSQTVAALPRIIDGLRAKGLELVPISQLAGWTYDQVMPPVPPEDRSGIVNWYVFLTASWLQATMHVLFLLAIGLGLARLVALCGLAIWSRYRPAAPPPLAASDAAVVSVLIPAFNEAKVIAGSVAHILQSRHVKLEVIVIDDGSTDATSDVVRENFAADPRVTLLTLPNGGKARAINAGLAVAHGEVVVRPRRRYAFRARHHCPARALVRRPQDRRRGRQRQGRQPHKPHHALAGAGVHNGPEPRAACALCPGLHHGGAGRRRCVAPLGAHRAGRLPHRYARRGSGSHHRHSEGRVPRGLRSRRRGLDGGAGQPSPDWPNSASVGRSARCNACGSTPTSRCGRAMARSASSRCRRPGCSRSCSALSRRLSISC